MAKQTKTSLRDLTDRELDHKLRTLQEELFKLRNDVKSGRIEKPHLIGQTRKDIARCHTIMRERKSAGK